MCYRAHLVLRPGTMRLLGCLGAVGEAGGGIPRPLLCDNSGRAATGRDWGTAATVLGVGTPSPRFQSPPHGNPSRAPIIFFEGTVCVYEVSIPSARGSIASLCPNYSRVLRDVSIPSAWGSIASPVALADHDVEDGKCFQSPPHGDPSRAPSLSPITTSRTGSVSIPSARGSIASRIPHSDGPHGGTTFSIPSARGSIASLPPEAVHSTLRWCFNPLRTGIHRGPDIFPGATERNKFQSPPHGDPSRAWGRGRRAVRLRHQVSIPSAPGSIASRCHRDRDRLRDVVSIPSAPGSIASRKCPRGSHSQRVSIPSARGSIASPTIVRGEVEGLA